jgi:GNAT superfamily N-acetyltransferase
VIRVAETNADLDAYARVWTAVHPDSPISGDEVRARLVGRDDGRRYWLASVDGEVRGNGFASAGSSVPGRATVAVAVLPKHRGGGLGSTLLQAALAHAASLGSDHAVATVREEELAWAERRGFAEVEREVQLVLDLNGDEQAGEPPPGIRIAPLDDGRFDETFALYAEGVHDMPDSDEYVVTRERFAQEVHEAPLVLIALDGDQVVGYAALDRLTDNVLGHQLTAVARTHRRQGIAGALKRAQIAWAAEQGVERLVTDTHIDNIATQRLNERLGYRPLPPLVVVRRELG